MNWSKKKEKWARVNYVGRKKKVKMTIDRDSSESWYFYGGGYNSLANGKSFPSPETAQKAAEMWIDVNWKTARID